MMSQRKALVIAMITAIGLQGSAWAAPSSDPFVDVIVVLKAQAVPGPAASPDRRERLRRLEKILREHADSTQRSTRGLLDVRRKQGKVSSVVPLWIINAIGATSRFNAVGHVIMKLEEAIASAMPFPRGIRCVVTARKPL